MSELKFTPGQDKVTSSFLVGEWLVHKYEGSGKWMLQHEDRGWVVVHEHFLSKVISTPIEPQIGAVVWAKGRYWMRGPNEWYSYKHPARVPAYCSWVDICDEAFPVIVQYNAGRQSCSCSNRGPCYEHR